jgi:hypothetical protein
MNWGLALIVGGVVLALVAPFVIGRFVALGDETPPGARPAAKDEEVNRCPGGDG